MEKIKEKNGLPWLNKDLLIALIIIMAVTASFGLGRLSAREKGNIKYTDADTQRAEAVSALKMPTGLYVASKSGSVYYFPWCAAAKRIIASNQIWFNSETEAINAGYRPAENCKGLK